jgi:hypothetical protein
MAVTMKTAVVCDVTLRGSTKNRRFGGAYRLHHQGDCVELSNVSMCSLHLEQTYVRFEVFTAVSMKNAFFRDVTPRGSCKNRCFGGTYRLH